MFKMCTDLSGLLVVLVEEVVSPALDAGLHVAPEVSPGRGQGQRGAPRPGETRHGQTHLAAEHRTPGHKQWSADSSNSATETFI